MPRENDFPRGSAVTVDTGYGPAFQGKVLSTSDDGWLSVQQEGGRTESFRANQVSDWVEPERSLSKMDRAKQKFQERKSARSEQAADKEREKQPWFQAGRQSASRREGQETATASDHSQSKETAADAPRQRRSFIPPEERSQLKDTPETFDVSRMAVWEQFAHDRDVDRAEAAAKQARGPVSLSAEEHQARKESAWGAVHGADKAWGAGQAADQDRGVSKSPVRAQEESFSY